MKRRHPSARGRLPASGPAHMRARLAREDGFTIIEVLAAAILVVLTAVGAFTAIDAAGKTADGNKSRNVAASLAQGDQERLRGLDPTELIGLVDAPEPARTETVDRESYTVASNASWANGEGTATTCTSRDVAPRYLKIVSTVRWPGMAPLKPVVSESLKAVNNATASGFGNLAIDVTDRTGATGVPGLVVTISGPVTKTQTTNANGCVFFDNVPVGGYTVVYERAGWIESKLPNRQRIEDEVVVASDQIASKSFQYARAGGAQVRFITRRSGTTDIVAAGDGFTVSNASLGTPPSKQFPLTLAPTLSTGLALFPFTGAYTLWAGRCADGDPLVAPNTGETVARTVLVAPGVLSAPVDIVVPTLKVTVKNGKKASDVLGGARVFVSSPGGCTTPPPQTTPTSGSDKGIVYFALPYGAYSVCAQNTVTNPTESVTAALQNRTRNGSAYEFQPKAPPQNATAACQ